MPGASSRLRAVPRKQHRGHVAVAFHRERKLRAREEAGNLDREMLGLVREIRSLKQKREDRARRIDAIAETELLQLVSPSETVKPVRSGNKKKA